jgi:drug/metabolite transporter (DMT)-like permease
MKPGAGSSLVHTAVPARGSQAAAVFWALFAAGMLSLMTFSVRMATHELHPLQVVFLRNAISLVLIAPWAPWKDLAHLGRRHLPFVSRALCEAVTMTFWFTALSVMPLTEAVALSFSLPLFVTLAAALLLGEAVARTRWAAVAMGFAGVVIVLRPGLATFSPAGILVLVASAAGALSNILVKQLTARESAQNIVFYMVLLLTPMSLVPALFVWHTPSPAGAFWAGLTALFATGAHIATARGLALGDVSFVMPWRYTQLVFTAALSYFALGEGFDAMTLLGIAVITASALFLALSERRPTSTASLRERRQ